MDTVQGSDGILCVRKKMLMDTKTGFISRKSLMELCILRELSGTPYIVQIHGYKCDPSGSYIDMIKYNLDMYTYIHTVPQRERKKHIDTFIQHISTALVYCESLGITHRDVKPENVLVKMDPDPIFYLCDFNLSEHVDYIRNRNSGTIIYAAPEILVKPNYGIYVPFKENIWSLGVTCYVLCEGKLLFSKNTIDTICQDWWSKADLLSLNINPYLETDDHMYIFKNYIDTGFLHGHIEVSIDGIFKSTRNKIESMLSFSPGDRPNAKELSGISKSIEKKQLSTGPLVDITLGIPVDIPVDDLYKMVSGDKYMYT